MKFIPIILAGFAIGFADQPSMLIYDIIINGEVVATDTVYIPQAFEMPATMEVAATEGDE